MNSNCTVCSGNGITVSFNPLTGKPTLEKCTACEMKAEKTEEIKTGEGGGLEVDEQSMDPKRNKPLPPIVKKLTHGFDAWIVGSAADPMNDNPKDYDIQVPFSSWGQACMLIPSNATLNAFGGLRFEDEDGSMIDVWAGELGWIMQRPGCRWAWQPKSGIFLTKVNM